MNFNLYEHTVLLTLGGSRAYGMQTETSDWDYRGLCIPPIRSYFVQPYFEQAVDKEEKKLWKNYPEIKQVSEMQVMELMKFFYLAVENNPAALEIIFTEPQHFLIKHPIMDRLLEIRHQFLCKKSVYRYCAYAHSQLEKMKRHKKWLDDPPKAPPTRAQFGLAEQYTVSKDQIGAANTLIEKEVNRIMLRDMGMNEGQQFELKFQLKQSMMIIWEALNQTPYPVGEGQQFEQTSEAVFELMGRKLGMDDNFLELLNAEKRFQAAKKDWSSYQTWLKERNPERAKMEEKLAYDSKNASHCIRLLRTGTEIITHKDIKVWREDAGELKSIRNGAWTYEQVLEYAQTQKQKLEVMENDLPREVNIKKLEPIVISMIEEFNGLK